MLPLHVPGAALHVHRVAGLRAMLSRAVALGRGQGQCHTRSRHVSKNILYLLVILTLSAYTVIFGNFLNEISPSVVMTHSGSS